MAQIQLKKASDTQTAEPGLSTTAMIDFQIFIYAETHNKDCGTVEATPRQDRTLKKQYIYIYIYIYIYMYTHTHIYYTCLMYYV